MNNIHPSTSFPVCTCSDAFLWRFTNSFRIGRTRTEWNAFRVKNDHDFRGVLADAVSAFWCDWLMWLARLTRPDLLRVSSLLATKIHVWSASRDAYLHPAICYLNHTKEQMLTGHIRDWSEDVVIKMICEVDFCGQWQLFFNRWMDSSVMEGLQAFR